MWEVECGIMVSWEKLWSLVVIGCMGGGLGKWIYGWLNLEWWLVNRRMLGGVVLWL